MADEEKTGIENDDWLDDFQDDEQEVAEPKEDAGQDDIDDLLGSLEEDEAPEASAQEEAAEEAPVAEAAEEVDQSDIDSLLGAGGGEEAPEEDAAAAAAEDELELDQSDIDSLLGGGSDDETPEEELAASGEEAPQEEELAEPDQADIDELLGGEDDDEQPEEVVVEGAEHFAQEEISGEIKEPTQGVAAEASTEEAGVDELLGDLGEEEAEEPLAEVDIEGEPSQEDMDQLFDGIADDIGEEEEAGAETVSFSEVLEEGDATEAAEEPGESGDESFGLEPDDSGFGDEDFDFEGDLGDIPDIPDESTISTEDEGTVAEDIFAEGAEEEELEVGEGAPKKFPFPISIPEINKTVIAGAGTGLVLIIGILFFVFRGKEEPPAIILPEESEKIVSESAIEPQPVQPLANAVPVVADAELEMAEEGGAISIELGGQDEDNDPLDFVITTPPQYGRLSGDVPHLTYLPNNDFPGEDVFEYRASDGKDVSLPASVSITGPDLSKKVVAEKPKVVKPKRPVVLAKNVTLKTKSTDDLLINWQKVWRRANNSPFNKKISVEIIDKPSQGRFIKTSRYKHLYRPDKFFGGHEIVKYRFSQEGIRSKVRKILIKVKLGSPAPEINLKPLAQAYAVGETVVVDASPSRDEARDKLHFDWQQTGGVPIQMEAANKEGSAIAFVVPSSFQTGAKYPSPVILLTATDQTGKTDTKEIAITTKSRRQAALWRGLRGGGVENEPNCPQGNCPGGLLPWPYAD